MSHVSYLDGIPHIVRYGMHDDKEEKCWVWFWRQGVRFIIDVHSDDVRGTVFYETWKPTLREGVPEGQNPSVIFQRWSDLCKCVIPAALNQLEVLAPVKPHWVTLRDYLHTPGYHLKVVKQAGAENGVAAEVTKGPEDVPAYEYQLQDRDVVNDLPDNFPVCASDWFTVLDAEKDWRQPPTKVISTHGSLEGEIFHFSGCEKSSRALPENVVTNASMSSIRAYIRVLRHLEETGKEWPAGLTRIRGTVLDSVEGGLDAPELRLAGILLSWTGNRSLWDLVRDASITQTKELLHRSQAWETAIQHTVRAMHAAGITSAGHIDCHTVDIDENDQAWLKLSSRIEVNNYAGVDDSKISDNLSAVSDLFRVWLPERLAKKQNTTS